jgi:ATP-dependent helicase/nuclease subunit B
MIQHNDGVRRVSRNHFAAKMVSRHSGARGSGVLLVLGVLARPATNHHEACKECGKKDSSNHTPVYNCATFNDIAQIIDWMAQSTRLSYNAEMGTSKEIGAGSDSGVLVDGWLRGGGVVIASSERARRALTSCYHRVRRAEGLSAWPAPAILDWQTFLRTTWEEWRAEDDRLLLSAAQEKSIWAGIAGAEQRLATLLSGPRNRMAALAMQAHQLLSFYAPQYLHEGKRYGWQQDAGIFSGWLGAFEATCNAGRILSTARLPLELIGRLEKESTSSSRPPLLLAGFDRILPVQRRLLDAWGTSELAGAGEPARETRFYRADDAQSELAACALWCKQKLDADPNAKLLVISQDLSQRRGEIERAFLELLSGRRTSPWVEFSLGIPLSKVKLAQSAYLLLRWLSNSIAEHELDWLFSSEMATANAQEAVALQSYIRALRRRGLERPQWSLHAFLNQPINANLATLPANWVSRVSEAQRRFAEHARTRRSPLDWAELIPHLLQIVGWPGARPLSSEEFQVIRRWELALESCASLGFDGNRISWSEFLDVLAVALDETLFAPESREAPIQIAGPAESAGLTADAIWFMGASEDAWPSSGATHPLLPLEVQRDAAMPHATSQLDWELSNSIVTRLLSSAPEVFFSFARMGTEAEARPSRMILCVAGTPQALPPELIAEPAGPPATENFKDFSLTSFCPGPVNGGASILTYQSQCPFKAFATARLAAQSWNAAEPCLTAAQRGKLLHAALHSIWGGSRTGGIQTLRELRDMKNREAFIEEHVSCAMQRELKSAVRERLPRGYLEMEEQRLNSLIGEWLEFELTRVEFTVRETEAERTVEIAGLSFDLRLDRIDELPDGKLLVIDYKTGQVKPKSWELPRPDDVQLPVYATYAVDRDALGGLVFAKVRRGEELEFAGHVSDARANLIPTLRGASSLVKNELDANTIDDWRVYIEKLARAFLSGHAEVDPREYPSTCERCELQTLCRIQEHRVFVAADDEAREEASDE